MQVPKRKKEELRKYGRDADDFLSAEAVRKLQEDVRRMEASRPRMVEELTRAREMGDLSENAAYSDAKGKLMGMDRRLFEIKEKLKRAVVIPKGPDAEGRARLGSTVTVRVNGKEKPYTLVGASEADPSAGRVSYHSPLGNALMGHGAGDTVIVKNAAGSDVSYEIIDVR